MSDSGTDPPGGREHDEPGGATAAEPGGQTDLLGEMQALRRQARDARHAYWFPLVLFGLLTCAAAPFYIVPGRVSWVTSSGLPLPMLGRFAGFMVQPGLGYYWLAALLGGLLLTLLWYRRNARRVGLQTPARAYLGTVAGLTTAALVIPLLSQLRSPRWLQHLHVLWPGDLIVRGTFPFLIIAAGLWVLARSERSRALAVIAAVYTAAALLSSLYDLANVLVWLGWTPSGADWSLASLPNVLLPALVLLTAGLGAFAVQRRHRTRA
ncbi:MAG: hypothetical protein ABJB47_08130 [Actinomycetota bacterium]